MRIKLRGHSCVEAGTIDGKVLLDPGGFSQLDDAFNGINAVLITHEHADHADQPAIAAALEANPVLELYAPEALAQSLRGQLPPASQAQVVAVRAGAAAGLPVKEEDGDAGVALVGADEVVRAAPEGEILDADVVHGREVIPPLVSMDARGCAPGSGYPPRSARPARA